MTMTSMKASTDVLLQPLTVGSLTLKNRIVSASHEPNYSENGLPTLRYQLYHEEKAKGGLALTMIGGSASVLPESTPTFGQLDLSSEVVLPHLAETARRVHRYGAAIMCQISHMGRRARWDSGPWLPVYSSSRLREAQRGSYPAVLEPEQLPRIVQGFADAALRVQAAGLDGVEIAGHAGHLIHQFMSERMNHRTDDYGGSFENRMRFPLDVLRAVRRALGADFVISLRLTMNEFAANGLTPGTTADIARVVAHESLVDFLSLVMGTPTSDRGLSQSIPPYGTPLGGGIDVAATIKAAIGDLPILFSGRLADLSTARYAITSGAVDLVGMVRAHIADPYLVRKLEDGQEDRIRPCVGAAYCINRSNAGQDALCIYNPATGREAMVPHYAPRALEPKRVVVVGGGPAGLEAARTAAERGHKVTLFEAGAKFGGQVRLAARASMRHSELAGMVEWLEAEARALGATLHANSFVSETEVLELSPDLVVLATGGVPATPPMEEGAELVVSTWDVVAGAVHPRGPVLVYDEHGGEQALAAVEYLLDHGAQIEFVTSGRMPGFDTGVVLYPEYLRAMYEHNVPVTTDHVLRQVIRRDGGLDVVLTNIFTDAVLVRQVSCVVAEAGTKPVLDLYEALKPRSRNNGQTDLDALAALRPQRHGGVTGEGFALHRVGDAVASRNVHAAVYDARRLILTT